MGNYRGISIMGAFIKIRIIVVTQRLQDVCETNQIIRRWQRRFILGEECPLQVASIFDIAGRRRALGLPTYVGFIDVRKAYDTIPRELLFSKLEAIRKQMGLRDICDPSFKLYIGIALSK
jgi:hypothetical protein